MPAGRPPGTTGVRLTESHRTKIQKSKILNRLIGHAEGTEEMSATQVAAALGLLKKALPDLSAVTIAGDADNPLHAKVELDAERFTRAIAGLVARAGTGAGNSGADT